MSIKIKYSDYDSDCPKNVVAMATDESQQNVIKKHLWIDPLMAPLIRPLAKQFPKWEFRGYHLRGPNDSGHYWPRRWSVYCGDEKLGEIQRDTYGDKPCYVISNHRIEQKRERGSSDKTTKVDRAKKLILKNFRPLDLKERMEKSWSRVMSQISSEGYSATSQWTNNFQKMCGFLSDHITENMDKYVALAIASGFAPEDEKRLRETFETYKIHRSIDQCQQKDRGAVVLIHGDTYAVEPEEGDFCVYENATLPSLIKRRVGMLKLLGDGETLINVGYRHSKTEFYISLEEDNGAV